MDNERKDVVAAMDVLLPEKRELPARGAVGGVLVAWDARELPGEQGGAIGGHEGGEALFYRWEEACQPLIQI